MNLLKYTKSLISHKQKGNFKKLISSLSPFIYNYLPKKNLNSLKHKINLYFSLFPLGGKYFINEIKFIKHRAKADFSISYIFPYSFVFDYDYNLIKVFKDEGKNLFYVIHTSKRLYFSRDYRSEMEVKYYYNRISIEQDDKSPHRYLSDTFNVEDGDIVVDIGAAEGNFSLEVIERASIVYIIESDPNWIEALEATFEPWKEKVYIMNNYISNIDFDKSIKLDKLLGNKSVGFIKVDAEGAELSILESSKEILQNSESLKIALCTYHRKNDAKSIEEFFSNNKFIYSYSKGYMLFLYNKLSPPYFRKAVIRAQKIFKLLTAS